MAKARRPAKKPKPKPPSSVRGSSREAAVSASRSGAAGGRPAKPAREKRGLYPSHPPTKGASASGKATRPPNARQKQREAKERGARTDRKGSVGTRDRSSNARRARSLKGWRTRRREAKERSERSFRGWATRRANEAEAAKVEAAKEPGKGTGSKTRFPAYALWPSPIARGTKKGRKKGTKGTHVPLLRGKPSAGEWVEVSAILALDQSIESTSSHKQGGPKPWVSDRFYLGRMTIADALSMDAESILARYAAAMGNRHRGKATKILALVRKRED